MQRFEGQDKCRHEANFNYRLLSSMEQEAFSKQGFLLLDDALTERGVAVMADQCMAFWSAKKGKYDPKGTWLKYMLLDNVLHQSRIVRDY